MDVHMYDKELDEGAKEPLICKESILLIRDVNNGFSPNRISVRDIKTVFLENRFSVLENRFSVLLTFIKIYYYITQIILCITHCNIRTCTAASTLICSLSRLRIN